MSRFQRELHEIKTEGRHEDLLLFLRACCVSLGGFWLFFGYSLSNWIGKPSWGMVVVGFVPVAVMGLMLAALIRTPALAIGLGLLSGSVLLIPFIPTNEWKAMNLQTWDLRVGMTSIEACAIVGSLEPACLHKAARGESVYLRPGTDDANDAAYINIDFEQERVSGIKREID